MKHYREKTPKLGEGLASNVLNKLFTQIKEQKGMTTFIQRHGVNGCWMKPDDLYDIQSPNCSRFWRILVSTKMTMTLWRNGTPLASTCSICQERRNI